jgi:hypothetical protein
VSLGGHEHAENATDARVTLVAVDVIADHALMDGPARMVASKEGNGLDLIDSRPWLIREVIPTRNRSP